MITIRVIPPTPQDDEAVDTDYWRTVQQQLELARARCIVKETHRTVLARKAELMAAAGSAEDPRVASEVAAATFSIVALVAAVTVAAVAINLLGLAGSVYAMNVYDRVVPNNATETLWVLTIGVLVVNIFEFLLRTARAYFIDADMTRVDFRAACLSGADLEGAILHRADLRRRR
jgi:ABC-type bacteriocin/lantibiotic exporter with double-glycine peptidase domain